MRILIAGDSWGCGAWEPGEVENRISHPGLEQFLKDDGHQVTNISFGGSCLPNIDFSLDCQNQQNQKYDLVFVFVTNSFRHIKQKNFWSKKNSYEKYLKLHNSILKNFVKKINQYDIGPIYLLGGLSKVSANHVKRTAIKIAIPSILELIVPGSKQYEMFFQEHLFSLSKYNVNKKLLKKVYEQELIWNQYGDHKMLQPDRAHPNQEAHYKIYEFLKSNPTLALGL